MRSRRSKRGLRSGEGVYDLGHAAALGEADDEVGGAVGDAGVSDEARAEGGAEVEGFDLAPFVVFAAEAVEALGRGPGTRAGLADAEVQHLLVGAAARPVEHGHP